MGEVLWWVWDWGVGTILDARAVIMAGGVGGAVCVRVKRVDWDWSRLELKV